MAGHFEALDNRITAGRAQLVVVGHDREATTLTRRALAAGFSAAGFHPFSGDRISSELDTSDGLDVVVVVPPLSDAGVTEFDFVSHTGWAIAPHLRPGTCVLLWRAVFPGTALALLASAFQVGSAVPEAHYALVHVPEHGRTDDESRPPSSSTLPADAHPVVSRLIATLSGPDA